MKKMLKYLFLPSLSRHGAKKDQTHMQSAMERLASRNPEIRTVIDVGASDGRWSAQAMAYFPDAEYQLIEANPVHKEGLTQFCQTHTNAGFEIAAASDKDGLVRFDGSDPFGGKAEPEAGADTIETKSVRLDSVVEGSDRLAGPYLLKLDTHGYEVPILDGAPKILEQANLVIIEVYLFRLSSEALLFDEMVALMRSKGFGVVDMSDPLWRPGDGCFWQMDLYFEPLTSQSLQNSLYS